MQVSQVGRMVRHKDGQHHHHPEATERSGASPPPLTSASGGLRQTELGHLYVQVSKCEGVVVVMLVVLISAVIKRLLWLRRWRRCSFWGGERNTKGVKPEPKGQYKICLLGQTGSAFQELVQEFLTTE